MSTLAETGSGSEAAGCRASTGKVGLGTPAASGFPPCCAAAAALEAAVTVFGAWMERMVVFFCREKGLGASRGLGARPGLGLEGPPAWGTSTELSMTESLKEERRREEAFTYGKLHIHIEETLSVETQTVGYVVTESTEVWLV